MEVTTSAVASALLSERPDRFPQDFVRGICQAAPCSEDMCEYGVRRQHVFHLLEKIPRWDKNWDPKYKEVHTTFLRWLEQLRDDLTILDDLVPAGA